MAARALYLGLDVGTQGTKGLVVDANEARVVARAARSYDLIGGLPEGAAEQHPDTWLAAVLEVGRELWAELAPSPGELLGIGVSGQQHGLVVLGEGDRVLRAAKLWCDTSTAAEAEELSARWGRAVPAGFTASKVLWLARHEPDVWARTRRVCLPHDYLNLRLTGEFTAECGDASGTGWFDAAARDWDPRAVESLVPDFGARLAPLLRAGAAAGALTREGAALLGLGPEHAGAPVAAGGGDNMLSAIGAGATRAGVCVLSLGTSATVFARSEAPVIDPEGAIAAFCDSAGGWLPLLCVMNATGVLGEVAAGFGTDVESLTRAAAGVEPGARGLRFLPYLAGERVPDLPHASGTLEGLRAGNLRPAVVFRAALEGVSLNLAWGVERLRALGLAVDRVRLVGGGARNELWASILADALDAHVEPCEEPESAALGAALQAVWVRARAADGRADLSALCAPFIGLARAVRPDPARVERYAELGRSFRAAVAARHGARSAEP